MVYSYVARCLDVILVKSRTPVKLYSKSKPNLLCIESESHWMNSVKQIDKYAGWKNSIIFTMR